MKSLFKPTQRQMSALLQRLRPLGSYRVPRNWVLTRDEITLLCRYSKGLLSGEYGAELPGKAADMRTMEDFTDALNGGYIGIERDHENAGLAWLWAQYTRNKNWFGSKELAIMRRCESFTFDGVASSGHQTAPTFTVHGPDGRFTYEAWSWQSGVAPKIV